MKWTHNSLQIVATEEALDTLHTVWRGLALATLSSSSQVQIYFIFSTSFTKYHSFIPNFSI